MTLFTTILAGFRRSRGLPLTAAAALCACFGSQVLGEGIWTPPGRPPKTDEGEYLMGELNCVACHTPTLATARRLASRPGPRLGQHGLRLAPGWTRRWLADHDSVKPASPMPDLLHGLSAGERAEAAEAITHYLVSIAPAGGPAPAAADEADVRHGGDLYHALGCAACHAPEAAAPDTTDAMRLKAAALSVPLGEPAAKYYLSELASFLRTPELFHPAARMPSLSLDEAESMAIAAYLVRDQLKQPADDAKPAILPGLKWQYFEGDFESCSDLDKAKPVLSGFDAAPNLKMARREGQFGVLFQASFTAPAEGDYQFGTRSDDGTVLRIDGRKVVDNDGTHAPQDRDGKTHLTAGAHGFELRFIQGGGGSELAVWWSGPGHPRGPLAAADLSRPGRPLRPVNDAPFTLDAAKADRGLAWFTKLNCVACHAVDLKPGVEPPRANHSKALAELAARPNAGCLSDAPPPAAPKFNLSPSQRAALRQTLARVSDLNGDWPAAAEATSMMTRLNCFACHRRDGAGGPEANGTTPWFTVVGNADLGDEGRIPPHLTGVGAKLRRTWMEKVLNQGVKVRPYMAVRMPRFGPMNVGRLASLLETADNRPEAAAEPARNAKDAKWGRLLAGRDGLSCIACHSFAQYPSLGIPALGLERMAERLRWDWFRRYLPDPAALRPGTRMPSFWPDGKAVNTAILNGDTGAQIQAIWAWLSAGDKAEAPDGLVRASKEIRVDREAVIYRNFIEGAGPRAIGVGYPEHANLAFDANNLRVALLWQGSFIDAARHSTDRGAGFEPPLGGHQIHLPEGAPFAWLVSPSEPWPKASGKAAGYQFLGYTLDRQRRPTFRYRFGGLEITDFPGAHSAGVDYSFERHFQFSGTAQPGQLWFRAAEGDIKALPDGSFEVNGQWRVKFRGTAGPPTISGGELRVPAPSSGEWVEEITW